MKPKNTPEHTTAAQRGSEGVCEPNIIALGATAPLGIIAGALIFKGIEAVTPLAIDNPEVSVPVTVVAGVIAMAGVARHVTRRT